MIEGHESVAGGAAAQRAANGAKDGAKRAAANSMMGMSLQVSTKICVHYLIKIKQLLQIHECIYM